MLPAVCPNLPTTWQFTLSIFVKSIGDAVMLVSVEAAPLLQALLDLADAAASNNLPPMRIGLASGAAITRAGDWFGGPVNLASKVTASAQPGTVLVADSTRDAIDTIPNVELISAGTRPLKGVSAEVGLFRAKRTGENGE